MCGRPKPDTHTVCPHFLFIKPAVLFLWFFDFHMILEPVYKDWRPQQRPQHWLDWKLTLGNNHLKCAWLISKVLDEMSHFCPCWITRGPSANWRPKVYAIKLNQSVHVILKLSCLRYINSCHKPKELQLTFRRTRCEAFCVQEKNKNPKMTNDSIKGQQDL